MTEALAVTPKPTDFPIVEVEQRINVRTAMAGIYLAQGFGSLTRCLVKAGYSRATARNLTNNGLGAKRCLDEALKLDPTASPAKLLEGGRRRLAESIAFIDPAAVPLRDVVRMFEATEKYFGGHELAPSNVTLGLVDRLAQIASLLAVAQHRGLPVPKVEPSYVEAQIVETPKEMALDQRKDRAAGTTEYVNSNKGGGDCIP